MQKFRIYFLPFFRSMRHKGYFFFRCFYFGIIFEILVHREHTDKKLPLAFYDKVCYFFDNEFPVVFAQFSLRIRYYFTINLAAARHELDFLLLREANPIIVISSSFNPEDIDILHGSFPPAVVHHEIQSVLRYLLRHGMAYQPFLYVFCVHLLYELNSDKLCSLYSTLPINSSSVNEPLYDMALRRYPSNSFTNSLYV